MTKGTNSTRSRVTKEIFLTKNPIMIWMVMDGGSRHANMPDTVRNGIERHEANRDRNKIAELMDQHLDLVKAARKRITEERRMLKEQQSAPGVRELAPA
jgi:hypothetical protein